MSPEEIATVDMKSLPADNMRFYNVGAEVPKEARKDFKRAGGFSGTDINRMWRIATLTRMFGPAGVGWNFKIIEIKERKLDASDRVVLFAEGELTYRDPTTGEWSQPITGYGGNDLIKTEKEKVFNEKSRQYEYTGNMVATINDEAYKMVETDAFGAACSKLGIGASVYWASGWGKYVTTSEEPETPQTITAAEPVTPAVVDPFFGASDKKKAAADVFTPANKTPAEAPQATPVAIKKEAGTIPPAADKSQRKAQEKALDKALFSDLSLLATMNLWLASAGKENTSQLTDDEFEQMIIDMGVQL